MERGVACLVLGWPGRGRGMENGKRFRWRRTSRIDMKTTKSLRDKNLALSLGAGFLCVFNSRSQSKTKFGSASVCQFVLSPLAPGQPIFFCLLFTHILSKAHNGDRHLPPQFILPQWIVLWWFQVALWAVEKAFGVSVRFREGNGRV